jgi:hypothetical protein
MPILDRKLTPASQTEETRRKNARKEKKTTTTERTAYTASK